jgi:hypothetical protein
MNSYDKSKWYVASAEKASKATGDMGVALILDHLRRVLR